MQKDQQQSSSGRTRTTCPDCVHLATGHLFEKRKDSLGRDKPPSSLGRRERRRTKTKRVPVKLCISPAYAPSKLRSFELSTTLSNQGRRSRELWIWDSLLLAMMHLFLRLNPIRCAIGAADRHHGSSC